MKDDYDFETWYSNLRVLFLEKVGFDFDDKSSVVEDYNNGKHFSDVSEELALEYLA